MSKLLLSLVDNDAYVFANIINDMNQIAKNLKKDSIYTIKDGVCYGYKSTSDDLVHQRMTYDTSSNRNKASYNGYIKLINGYLEGKEFFAWFNECKKFINKVELYNDCFKIFTTSTSKIFESGILNKENLSVDVTKFNSYINRVYKDCKEKVIYKDEEFHNILNEINIDKMNKPYECRFEVKKKDGKKKVIKFRITKKIFLSFKKESVVKLYVSSIDVKNKVYEVKYIIENKNSSLENYATIVNY